MHTELAVLLRRKDGLWGFWMTAGMYIPLMTCTSWPPERVDAPQLAITIKLPAHPCWPPVDCVRGERECQEWLSELCCFEAPILQLLWCFITGRYGWYQPKQWMCQLYKGARAASFVKCNGANNVTHFAASGISRFEPRVYRIVDRCLKLSSRFSLDFIECRISTPCSIWAGHSSSLARPATSLYPL